MLTRRHLIAAVPLVAPAHAAAQLPPSAVRSRPQVYASQGSVPLLDYRDAVDAMLRLPYSDPRNWYRQALIHVADCPHGNWWFLPWHRGYLARFEAICGELIRKPEFRLPYWDYTESPSVPDAFWTEGLDPSRPPFADDPRTLFDDLKAPVTAWIGSLSEEARADMAMGGAADADGLFAQAEEHWGWGHGARGPTAGEPALNPQAQRMVGRTYLTSVLNSRTFERFGSGQSDHHRRPTTGGLLESGPHDNVHGAAGGFMGAFMSPVDPLFWLHHANLDRLWDIWARRKGFADGTGLPVTTPDDERKRARFEGATFRFFCDAKGAATEMTAANCVVLASGVYDYQPGSLSDLARAQPSPPGQAAVSVFSSMSATLNARFRNNFETSTAVAVDRGDLLASLQSETSETVATITVTPPANAAEARIRLYLNCPYLSRFTPIEDPHYVGTISFFGALHHAGHGAPTTVTVALGPTLEALRETGDFPRSALRVQLIPETTEGEPALLGGSLDEVTILIE